MKLLHLILDGYNDSDQIKLFNEEYVTRNLNNSHERVLINTYTDGQHFLKSARMWFRYYSREYPTKLTDANGKVERIRYASLYSNTPGEKLIWRILASRQVPCYIYPFNYLANNSAEWLIGDKNDPNTKYLNGEFKSFYSKTAWVLEHGKLQRVNTPYVCSALNHNVSNDCSISNNTELLNALNKFYAESNTNEELAKNYETVRPLIEKEFYDNTKLRLDENRKEFDERILPGLVKFETEYTDEDDQYINVAFGETDCMYHYRPFKSIVDGIIKPYMNYLMKEIIDDVKPDVLIISGDHNMSNPMELEKYNHRANDNSRAKLAK